MIKAVATLGLVVGRSERQTGVWAGEAKVCAIGVRVTHRTVTLHGFGLNCDTDLSWFDSIVPCGLAGVRTTSLSELAGHRVPVDAVRPAIRAAFEEVFDRKLVPAEVPIGTPA